MQLTSNTESVITVSALNRLARNALEAALPLMWVSGEVSNLTHAASGHAYFTLKDDAAQARCVMFRQRAQLLPFRLCNGARVEVRVLVTLYEPRGDYQLSVETIRHAGIGALYEAFHRLREHLAAEGLFDASRKRPLPPFPHRIGVITSLQAAALRDILTALARRAPHLPVLVLPVPVQGPEAAPAMVAALEAAQRTDCEVLIIARGGGSIEDLWAFNDETLARALAASPLPVVTGVGHETDTTIADFVADQRAATPTAAAELVSAGFVAAGPRLARLAEQLTREAQLALNTRLQRIDLLTQRLVHPGEQLARSRVLVRHLADRIDHALALSLADHQHRLDRLRWRAFAARPSLSLHIARIDALSKRLRTSTLAALAQLGRRLDALAINLSHLDPAGALRRGYAIVRDPGGRIVRSSRGLQRDDELAVQFERDAALVRVIDTSS